MAYPAYDPSTVGSATSSPSFDRASSHDLKYSGVWWRVAAQIVDNILLNLSMLIISIPVTLVIKALGTNMIAIALSWTYLLAYLAAYISYYAYFESGPKMATPGKRLLGIKVSDLEGRRISFLKASLRFITKAIIFMVVPNVLFAIVAYITFAATGSIPLMLLAGLSCMIIYVACMFLIIYGTKRKQGLHDMLLKTIVIKKTNGE